MTKIATAKKTAANNKAQTLPLITADIHSIKCSVKLAQKVNLDAVVQYWVTVINKGGDQVQWKRYPNFIVMWSTDAATLNKRVKYTLFKYSDAISKRTDAYYYRQHCNVCGLKGFADIVPALDILATWLALPVEDLFLQVDNLIATAKLPSTVCKLDFVRANPHVKTLFQLERFPSIILKPNIRPQPQNGMLASLVETAVAAFKVTEDKERGSRSTGHSLSKRQQGQRRRRQRKSAGIAILLYASGSTVISGAKTVGELTDCCQFLAQCFAAYQMYQKKKNKTSAGV